MAGKSNRLEPCHQPEDQRIQFTDIMTQGQLLHVSVQQAANDNRSKGDHVVDVVA